MLKTCLQAGILCGLIACADNKGTNRTNFQGQQKEPEKKQEDNNTPETKKIDPRTISVTNILIFNLEQRSQSGFVYGNGLTFETRGEAIDYVSVKICPLDSQSFDNPAAKAQDCIEDVTTVNFITLTPIFSGRVEVALSACLKPEHSTRTDETCGSVTIKQYQSKRACPEALELLTAKRQHMVLIRQDLLDFQKDMDNFVKEANECQLTQGEAKAYLDKKVDFVKGYREFVGHIGDGIESVVDKVGGQGTTRQIVSGASDAYESFSKELYASCRTMARSIDERNGVDNNDPASTGNTVCTVFKTLGHLGEMMVGSLNLSTPLGTFYSSYSDLMTALHGDPSKIVPRSCHADENYRIKESTIKGKLSAHITGLSNIKTSLDALAGKCPTQ